MQDLATALPGLHAALAVLAPRKRFDLLRLVLAGPARSVSALAAEVGLSQSCTTRHLQALERAGFVVGARDGKRVVFRAAPRESAARVLQALAAGEAAVAGGAPSPPARARRGATPRRPRAESGPVVIEGPAATFLAGDSDAHSDLPEPPSSRADPPGTHVPVAQVAAFAAASDEGGQDAAESGNNSTPAGPPPRRPNDLEDYLL